MNDINTNTVCAGLTSVFNNALVALRTDEDDADPDSAGNVKLQMAFEVAKLWGWNYDQDASFEVWRLKATTQEICVEGLRRALAEVCS